MDDKKTIKIGLGTVICIFIIILLVIALGIVYYLGFVKNSQEILALKDEINILNNKNASIQSENLTIKTGNANTDSKTTIELENATETEKKQIEEYIAKIYPISPCDSGKDYFEEFSSIKNANQEWIWSTTLRECSEDKNSSNYYNSDINEINETAKKLYGEEVGKLPVEKINEELNYDLYIEKIGDNYEYMGNHISGEDSTEYKILTIKKENTLFKVELVQYSIHHWSDGIWISSVNPYKKLKNISELDDNIDMDKINKQIDNYINNNIDKLDKVELTIEYDKDSIQYHVISIAHK